MNAEQLVESVRKHAKTVLLPSVAQSIVEELEAAPTPPAQAAQLVAFLQTCKKINGGPSYEEAFVGPKHNPPPPKDGFECICRIPLYTFPPDAARRIAEMEAERDRLLDLLAVAESVFKHAVAFHSSKSCDAAVPTLKRMRAALAMADDRRRELDCCTQFLHRRTCAILRRSKMVSPKESLLERVKAWYALENNASAVHAWLAGAYYGLPLEAKEHPYVGKLLDAIFLMPREEFFSFAEQLAGEDAEEVEEGEQDEN